MYWIGFDVGSSSIKAALVNVHDGSAVDIVQFPEKEMSIISKKSGWAEQDPEIWWQNLCTATQKLLSENNIKNTSIKGIGISYQMHGLVIVDKKYNPLRPSIIWCDSRAVDIGAKLFQSVGEDKYVDHLLNSPGNFTLSKLKWIQENEPSIYKKIHKFMLPGDYIALKLSGECITTPSGLSEGIMWDFKENQLAAWLLENSGVDSSLVPEIRSSFSEQGTVSKKGALESGLPEGIPIMYRAGDQPNNALALNVMEPGQVAATGGTSGVVYAISEQQSTTEHTRINSFAHTNHSMEKTRIGKLLCINGTGIQYSWIKNEMSPNLSYNEMNKWAESIPIGSDGLCVLPFGNGAERMLENRGKGSQILHLNFNIHKAAHVYRAALEGIAFSFVYGMGILKNDGVNISAIKAGNDNLFRSSVFSKTIATLTQAKIDIVETTGAIGAARAAAYAFGDFKSIAEATASDTVQKTYEPDPSTNEYQNAYQVWEQALNEYMD
ncbi:MAG: FGGY family carbohydrate kinase [Bacteroidota bacterium]|uniref:Carbohydrate kinase n=1 Tax=Flagellimonas profundi TaxID=2915620 RepID=A0ABS3FHB0_9FLAO|nr:FGGY family carbohydrate kinase [Allomuricauda profundi]MBO0342307.1 carbohydrate kinase [Allomuricauda profundi]MEC7772797.1 FGGY family carbohydrate kinase [Bacteroidota bacterium]